MNDDLREWYAGHRVQASACVACGECLERCPVGVGVVAKMQQAVARFEGGV